MKINEFFEKHVQWIALGLAGIWLLWVGWSYGVNRPEVDLGGTKFSPGAVDEYIRETDATALTNKMNDPNVPAGLVDVPDFTEAFVNSMNGKQVAPMTAVVVNSPPPYQEVVIREPGKKPIKGSVKEVPEVTIPTEIVAVAGRSQVIVEPPKVVNAAGATTAGGNTAEGAARPSIFDTPQPQPQPQVQPAAAAVPAAAPLPGQPAGTQMDKTWVTVFAKLNFTDQDSKFGKANIPPSLMQKQYIEVQLQRQEVLPDGTFGTIEVVKGLPRNQPPVDRSKPTEFVKWSLDPEAQKMILAPAFYFVVKGTAWEIPHKDVPAVAQVAQEFNLQQKYGEYKQLKTKAEQDKFVAAMTPEQKKQFYDYRLAQEQQENKAKAPPPAQNNQRYTPGGRGTPGGPGGRGGPIGGVGGRGAGDAVDPALLREMYADDPSGVSRRRPMPSDYDVYSRRRDLMRRNFGEDYTRRPMYKPEEGNINPNQQQILGSLIPDAAGNVDIWAHDETAQPGRTYRYRLRAIIKNPLFDTKNWAADPALEKPPYLPADTATGSLNPEAAWSDWTKPIAIPTNVDMMLVAAQTLNGREIARFRIKRFQEGQINEAPKPFEVAPGDTIGGKEKIAVAQPGANGASTTKQIDVDFTTNWMLVDIRPMGNDYRVRIMDPQGRMEVRTLSGDRNKFKDEPAKPAAGAQQANSVGMLNRPN